MGNKIIWLFLGLCVHAVIASEVVPIISVREFVRNKNNALYIKCNDRTKLSFVSFPLASSEDATHADPIIPETFILHISNGRMYAASGIVVIDNYLIDELIWPWSSLKKGEKFNVSTLPACKKIAGKVAIITQEGCNNYYHWVAEVLPKLALLEAKKIEYDWLYVPAQLPFMRETLALLGVDAKKIIDVQTNLYIEADELIVPSFVSRSCYTPQWVVDYMRNKYIPLAQRYSTKRDFAQKIFISRNKASYRRIINEDAVFSMFERLGFQRYYLEELPFLEQVLLFKNAEIIAAPHGAGLVNLIFASPETRVIEFFQEHEDDTFWYLSQVVGLSHTCIKTTDFRKNGGYTDTIIPLTIVESVINSIN